jgi:hypothetical protein
MHKCVSNAALRLPPLERLAFPLRKVGGRFVGLLKKPQEQLIGVGRLPQVGGAAEIVMRLTPYTSPAKGPCKRR